MRQEARTVPVE